MNTLRRSGIAQHCLVLEGELQNFDPLLKENPEITCVIQKNRLGTGDAVASAMSAFSGYKSPHYTSSEIYRGHTFESSHVLISAGDTPALSEIVLQDFISQCLDRSTKLAVIGMRHPKPSGYGRLLVKDQVLERIVEEKDADDDTKSINLCNTGVIFAETSFLFDLIHQLNNHNAHQSTT